MVLLGSPDNPQDCDDGLSTSEAGIIVLDNSSSDEDADPAQIAHYMPLAQAPTDAAASDSEDTEDDEDYYHHPNTPASLSHTTTGPSTSLKSDVDDSGDQPSTVVDSQQVWSVPREQPNITLNSEQVDQVRAAMANFNLPTSSIPPWAAAVPEEQWREQLLDRIQRLQQGTEPK